MNEKLPPLQERPPEAIDHIWYLALPVFYVVMCLYGIFAAVFPINSVVTVQGFDRAQLFGGLVAINGLLMLIGTLISLYKQRPHFELWVTTVFLVLMVIYFHALYQAAIGHEMGARPGSAFLPLLFSIFPFFRILVILRGDRVRWVKNLTQRMRRKRS